ncbi:LicD family protein [Methanobrevibacter sp.]|uniref:LicD family protein n=1 Tax=Methanobrevibacter sp. TaxID=66852 RepID=UPI003868C299
MNNLQKNLFNLLVEIDDICQEYDIDYCLAGGAGLGAKRNHCFLPWDDDIDLYITRDNWDKLYELISNNPDILPENRELVCYENSKYYRNPIVRYVDKSTTTIYPSQSFSAKTCGDQIEFFILDPVPNVGEGQEEYIKLMRVYLELLSPNFLLTKRIPLSEYLEHKDLVLSYYDKMDKEGYDNVMKELFDKVFTFPLEKADTFCMRWGVRTILHKTKFYSQKRYEEFEGRMFPVAYELEHMLRVDYGDSWMYIPKVEKQLTHNPLIKDLNHPFEDFTSIYLQFINQDEIIDSFENIKRTNMDLWVPKKEISIEKLKMKGIIINKELPYIIEKNKYDLKQLLLNHEFEILDELFNEYYGIQLTNTCIRYNVMIDIKEDYLKIAIENKIRQGLYYTASTILDIVEANNALTPYLQHLKDICSYCRSLSIAIFDDSNVAEVNSLLNNIDLDCVNLIDTYRATLWANLKNSKEDYENIIKKGNEMLIDYPDDGEIMSYIAEAYYKLGNLEEATKMYDKAVHNTRNGIIWQKAKEYVNINRLGEEKIDSV